MVNDDASAKYADYADYLVNHERGAGIGPLSGWRGKKGEQSGIGAPNPEQLKKYQENNCFFASLVPEEARYLKHANKAYLEWAKKHGFIGSEKPIIFELYSEALQKFRLAADEKITPHHPAKHKQRVATYFEPIEFW